jgi:hypothetical protein
MNKIIITNITVESYNEGKLAAYDYFVDSDYVSINKIKYDLIYGASRREITTYECYADSGSSDYFYFEVATEEEFK